MTTVLQHHNINGRINSVINLFDLGIGTVLIIFALNCQDGNTQIVDYFGDIPILKIRMQPRIVPASERIVGIIMIFCHTLLEVFCIIESFGFCNFCKTFGLGKEMRCHQNQCPYPVIFDAARKTFRSDIYPEYKAHRPPSPEELVPQFALITELVEAFNLPAVKMPGFEADDLIVGSN